MNSHLILLLHAHLPYVRHPEYDYSLEENWLFEAIRETYIPLLDMLERLVNDGISPHLTLSISPTLSEMLNDALLRDRFVRHMDNLIELSEAEKKRTQKSVFEPLAYLYSEQFKCVRRLYLERYKRDVVSAFRKLQDEGHIEIVTTCATHAFLPAYEMHPAAVKSQIDIGIKSYVRNFGRRPQGFWLPECGYFKGLDFFLKDAGIRYFFMESHGVINGRPRPGCSIYKPVSSPAGLTVFGRDFKSASQVWCASRGYPGEPLYRDFYRDIGFDLPLDYIGKFTRFKGIRTFTGIKYHSVTGKTDDKLIYNRAEALKKTGEHARHFMQDREFDFDRLSKFGFCPVMFSAFDAELFGHWWFEGIEWLEALFRNISGSGSSFRMVGPTEYLSEEPAAVSRSVDLSPSSWGEGGYNSLWIGERNNYLYRHIHKAIENMEVLSTNAALKKKSSSTRNIIKRAVNQAMRELLLSQASDWFFLMEKGRSFEYAESRVSGHLEKFNMLFSMVMDNDVDESILTGIEESDTIFSEDFF